jgi:hypothetical protein
VSEKEGHFVTHAQFTCRVEGSSLDGAVMAGSQIYEYQGADGVGLAGYGVVRKQARPSSTSMSR